MNHISVKGHTARPRFRQGRVVLVSIGMMIGAVAGCPNGNEPPTFVGPGAPSASSAGGSGTLQGGGGVDFSGVGGSGNSGPCDPSVPDADGDGFTEEEGDCEDCEPNINPGAIEVPTDTTDPDAEPIDEDCDGEIDEAVGTCDDQVSVNSTDPRDAARAMEMCDDATPNGLDYGVLDARWTHADGSAAQSAQDLQHGLQTNFGPNVTVQAGDKMAVLSSGLARLPGQTGAAINHSANAQGPVPFTPPQGFPQDVPGCSGGQEIYDDIALEVELRAPTNATGFRYDFKFYSFEFAEYVCTTFNDQYIALVDPAPEGAINGNVSFDSNNNPVSVNIAYFRVCDPALNNDFALNCTSGCPSPPSPYCPDGPSELLGTGFDDAFGSFLEDAGATTWLETTAPVSGGEELTIRFAIWDTGDGAFDSTVLLDGFEWIATPGTTVVTQPPVN